jgi:hypothetical protein
MKYLIALAFVSILAALALAGIFMLRDSRGLPNKGKMMRALAVRVALSAALFLCIWLSYWAGWIQPSGMPLSG